MLNRPLFLNYCAAHYIFCSDCSSPTGVNTYQQNCVLLCSGPLGAPGTVGSTGSTGPAGDTGITGPAGSPGLFGPRGDTGQTGFTGPKGATGLPGAAGLPGIAGDFPIFKRLACCQQILLRIWSLVMNRLYVMNRIEPATSKLTLII
jgi:Collagen triple helix repeat (20 copies)